MSKKLVLFSGGPDSTSAAFILAKEHEVMMLTLADGTGLKNSFEISCARRIATEAGFNHKVINISAMNALFDDVPNTTLGLGGAKISVPEELISKLNSKNTCVAPGVNEAPLGLQFVHMCAAIYGVTHHFDSVVWGVHKDDDVPWKPWISEYVEHFNQLMSLSGYLFKIETPFIHFTKAELLSQGMSCGAPLLSTASCLMPEANSHCGKCDGCKERQQAFTKAQISEVTTEFFAIKAA